MRDLTVIWLIGRYNCNLQHLLPYYTKKNHKKRRKRAVYTSSCVHCRGQWARMWRRHWRSEERQEALIDVGLRNFNERAGGWTLTLSTPSQMSLQTSHTMHHVTRQVVFGLATWSWACSATVPGSPETEWLQDYSPAVTQSILGSLEVISFSTMMTLERLSDHDSWRPQVPHCTFWA